MRHPLAALGCTLLIASCGASAAPDERSAAASADVGRGAVLGEPVGVGADTVSILSTGEPTFAELRRLIEGARQRVEVEVYEFGSPELVGAVEDAHRRGVAVTVIDDPTERATARTARQLRSAGVTVLDYPVRARMIDHVKLLVIDGAVAVVGGINWGSRSYANHDFDAEVRGPVVANLERVFLQDVGACGQAVTVPPARPDAAMTVATTLPGEDILPLVLSALDSAHQRIDVAMYTLTERRVVAAIEAAAARGVAVRVLLDPSERPSDAAAAALRAHGVPVRLYRGRGEKLHAKVGIVDGASVVFGSANWTVSGFGHNHELDVGIPAAPAVAAAFESRFQADWEGSG